MPGEFLDSNVLIYAFSSDPRAETAQMLLQRGCTISVQGLNEFTNVARRKLGMNWTEIGEALSAVRALCPTICGIDLDTHVQALRFAEGHGYGICDALVIASAIATDCDVLWTEDMQDGIVIEKRLRISNPFR